MRSAPPSEGKGRFGYPSNRPDHQGILFGHPQPPKQQGQFVGAHPIHIHSISAQPFCSLVSYSYSGAACPYYFLYPTALFPQGAEGIKYLSK